MQVYFCNLTVGWNPSAKPDLPSEIALKGFEDAEITMTTLLLRKTLAHLYDPPMFNGAVTTYTFLQARVMPYNIGLADQAFLKVAHLSRLFLIFP